MSDKKHNRNASPPGGDRPLRRPASKSGPPGKSQGKFPGKPAAKTFDKSNAQPRGKAFAKDGGGQSFGAPGGKRPLGKKPLAGNHAGAASGRPAFERPARASAETAGEKAFAGDRIAKVMARAGVCSRRDAEVWIAEGRVAVNGRALSSPAVNVSENDRIEIDGKPMQARERTRMFLFHKPAGLVTSARDPEGRETVFAYLDAQRPELPRVVSVGRLDINTEGLLLLTNDGGLARTLELPATGWTRRYRVRAHGAINQAQLDALKQGVIVEGVVYAPIDAQLERVQGANAWIAMSLTEGKNREIKRVLAHLGLEVTRLIRVSYGPFQLGDLPEGAVEEVRLKVLREQLGKNLAELAGVDFSAPARELTAAEREEMRQRVEKRPRKHISVLRRQRAEQAETGPRARIERGATADRKGRAVLVERVTPTRSRAAEDAPTTRNARRFEAMRSGDRPPRRERSASPEEMREARPQRRPRADVSNEMRSDWRREATERGGNRQTGGGQGSGRPWSARPEHGGERVERSHRAGWPQDRPPRRERSTSPEEMREARPQRRPRADVSNEARSDWRREATERGGDRQAGGRQGSGRPWSARPEHGGERGDRSHRAGRPQDRQTGWRDERRESPRDAAAPRDARARNDDSRYRTGPGDQKRERPAGAPGRSGGKPGGKFGGKFDGSNNGRSGERSGERSGKRFGERTGERTGARFGKGPGGGPGRGTRGGPGKGPGGDRPPRKPRGA